MKALSCLLLFIASSTVSENNPPQISPPSGEACPEQFTLASTVSLRCDVIKSDIIKSSEDGFNLRYTLYRLSSDEYDGLDGIYNAPPYSHTGVILSYIGRSDPFWFLQTDLGNSWFETPYIAINNEYGEFLVVREKYAGTGVSVDDHVFFKTEGNQWDLLRPLFDPEAGGGVVEELISKLPPATYIRKAIYIDYANLTAETSLWRKDDANCCGSAGRLKIQFALNPERSSLIIHRVERIPTTKE